MAKSKKKQLRKIVILLLLLTLLSGVSALVWTPQVTYYLVCIYKPGISSIKANAACILYQSDVAHTGMIAMLGSIVGLALIRWKL